MLLYYNTVKYDDRFNLKIRYRVLFLERFALHSPALKVCYLLLLFVYFDEPSQIVCFFRTTCITFIHLLIRHSRINAALIYFYCEDFTVPHVFLTRGNL